MFLFLSTFSGYRYAVARRKYKNLRQTTMQTFFKICPREYIHRHDEQNGFTTLLNKSLSYWMHLDSFDEEDVRGLEINSLLIDQAEEIPESIVTVMDGRIGRWDGATVPEDLLLQMVPKDYLKENFGRDEILDAIEKYSLWPRNKFNRFLVPNHSDILCNPTEAGELHWIYRWYHPNSLERKKHFYFIEREMDEDLGDAATIEEMKNRDPEYVETYIKGTWGTSRAQIHIVNKLSIISVKEFGAEKILALIETIKKKAAIYRVLDHGETGVTCCLWFAALSNIHICFQEYYISSTLISNNRQNISDLSVEFPSYFDLADPDIFKKHSQKEGAFTTVAQEYSDTEITDAPPITWFPADNNEFATRNRINEFLSVSSKENEATWKFKHPITGENGPRLYFLESDQEVWHNGCHFAISQLKTQRKKLLGSDNGKNIYSVERDGEIVDHAYDPTRYYIAHHSGGLSEPKRKPPRMSLAYYKALRDRRPHFYTGSAS